MTTLKNAQARRLLLSAQGLSRAPVGAAGPGEVMAAIRRMHALQIDTISVVARSPYFVLWSRIGDYDPALLDGLLADHALFEYWSHAACFIDVADYPYYRRLMLDSAIRWLDRAQPWMDANPNLLEDILARIRDFGPVRSSDFERSDGRKGGGWWDWKVEKMALELLHSRGDLMISARRNFQRIYDLRERVLPEWDDSLAPPIEEAHRELILRAVKTLGVARPEWVRESLSSLSLGVAGVRKGLRDLAGEGRVTQVQVEGWTGPGFVHPDNLALLDQLWSDDEPVTALLSPFDSIVRDRARALDLFHFDYRIECYTPAPKRRYGYFTLPILHGDTLAGRLDPKAHRKLGVFEVKSIHLEPDVAVDGGLVAGLRDVLLRIAAWHKTPEVVIGATSPASLAEALGFPLRWLAEDS